MTWPPWLILLSWTSLVTGLACAFIVAYDLLRHPQQMAVMNVVWPMTSLYSGPLGLAAYVLVGRDASHEAFESAKRLGQEPAARRRPFWQAAGLAATHCGAGCTLGDLVAEWLVVAVPVALFGSRLAGTWTLDFALAFSFGIAFQYLTIVPMRHLPPGRGLVAALKADALSLTAWQVGMYGFMAIMIFAVFDHEIPKTSPVFWFVMQGAMMAGYLTSYPVNWWLIRAGLKEKM
jgi:hypothetical protein